MTCSIRIFIVGADDTLYRLARAKFSGMLVDPESYRLPRYAGQRVRMVEAIVELRDRVPCGIARLIYGVLRFDEHGRLDSNTFMRQNFALADLIPDKPKTNNTVVVDASSSFVAQGGRWQPSPTLARCVRQTALGEIECKRL